MQRPKKPPYDLAGPYATLQANRALAAENFRKTLEIDQRRASLSEWMPGYFIWDILRGATTLGGPFLTKKTILRDGRGKRRGAGRTASALHRPSKSTQA